MRRQFQIIIMYLFHHSIKIKSLGLREELDSPQSGHRWWPQNSFYNQIPFFSYCCNLVVVIHAFMAIFPCADGSQATKRQRKPSRKVAESGAESNCPFLFMRCVRACMRGWVGEWVSESEWVYKWVSGWWVGEWVNDSVIEWPLFSHCTCTVVPLSWLVFAFHGNCVFILFCSVIFSVYSYPSGLVCTSVANVVPKTQHCSNVSVNYSVLVCFIYLLPIVFSKFLSCRMYMCSSL